MGDQQIIDACTSLTDEQLDSPFQSAIEANISSTLLHLVSAQVNYLRLLTLPLDQRQERINLEFADME
ncbi:MAG TPA: hypothetical protein DCX53_09535, partial [Anaerolineae bacterium]|nr:hypothetical protein [Anaerolineae bacterium]